MKSAPLPANESERLAALRRYGIVDSEFERDYQDIAELAATICGTPIALLSFVEEDRQWFKARIGLEAQETTRDIAFCAHGILRPDLMEIPDAMADERFHDNPLVTSEPNIRFYAGMPIVTREGHVLGMLCAIDRVPRKLSEGQIRALQVLSRQIMEKLDLRLANRRLAEQAEALKSLNQNRERLFKLIAHDLRSPFQGLLTLAEMLETDLEELSVNEVKSYLGLIHESAGATHTLLENLLQWAMHERGSLSVQPQFLRLSGLCQDAVSVLATTLERKQQSLRFEVPDTLVWRADRKMCEAIIRNLVANAAKFSAPGAVVEIFGEPSAEGATLHIRDQGVGMQPERRLALLDGTNPHSTSGTAGESGTGLGFQLVREFIAMNGGTWDIDTAPGQGTTVIVTFPSA